MLLLQSGHCRHRAFFASFPAHSNPPGHELRPHHSFEGRGGGVKAFFGPFTSMISGSINTRDCHAAWAYQNRSTDRVLGKKLMKKHFFYLYVI